MTRLIISACLLFHTIPAVASDAQFISANVLSPIRAGQPFEIAFEFRNHGQDVWPADTLRWRLTQGADVFVPLSGALEHPAVARNQSLVFLLQFTAPDQPGEFPLQIQLFSDASGDFSGGQSQTQMIVVPDASLQELLSTLREIKSEISAIKTTLGTTSGPTLLELNQTCVNYSYAQFTRSVMRNSTAQSTSRQRVLHHLWMERCEAGTR